MLFLWQGRQCCSWQSCRWISCVIWIQLGKCPESPPYSHQSQGKVERFHRNLFDQVWLTRLQWSRDLNFESSWTTISCVHQGGHFISRATATTTVPTSLVLESVFLERSATSQLGNCDWGINNRNEASGQDVTSSPMSTSWRYLFSTAHVPQQRLELTSAGRSLVYPEKNSMTSTSRRTCRGPNSMDIDFKTKRHFDNLQKENFATCNLQMQEPQGEEDIEQPLGVRPPVLRHHLQAVAQPQEQHPTQPPPGLPQPPQFKQQAAPLAAPPLQGPPPKVQAAPAPHAPQAVRHPAGKPYSQPRDPPPRPQGANIIDLPQPAEHPIMLGPDLVDISVDTGVLQVATNIVSVEQQLQENLIKQTVELQDCYEDDLSQYTADDIKAAIASELHSLGKMNICGEFDIDSLTAEQRWRIIKARWVIRPRPMTILYISWWHRWYCRTS